MKKLLVLLMALLLCAPALAEEAAPLTPFAIDLPEGVTTASVSDTSITYVHPNGTTRVVAMVISRVPDVEGDHAAELRRLMSQFAPAAQSAEPLTMTAGLHGLRAVNPGALEGASGVRIDQVTVMVLWQTALRGELLILSGYDMAGDAAQTEAFISELLSAATVNDAPLMPPPDADAQPAK